MMKTMLYFTYTSTWHAVLCIYFINPLSFAVHIPAAYVYDWASWRRAGKLSYTRLFRACYGQSCRQLLDCQMLSINIFVHVSVTT